MLPLRAFTAMVPRRFALSLAPHPFIRYLIDFFYMSRWRSHWVRIEGAIPRPPFVVTSTHAGHWEMGGAALGLRVPLTVLVDDHPDAKLLRFKERTRARFGIETIVRRGPVFWKLLDSLHRGRAVALLTDRDPRGPQGAALLARRAGCPLLAAKVLMERDYRLVLSPPCGGP